MVPGLGAAAVRVYSGFRGTNRSEIICLFDWADMRMSAIISDCFLHAIRTSAPYGVAAKHLARANASTLGIIGSGRYARGMAQAICAVRPIEKIKVYSRSPANVQSFCDDIHATLGIAVEPCGSGRDAVRGADIVVTATSGNKIVFEADWLEPGVLMMSLAPGEFDEQTVLRSRVFLSAVDQVLGDDPPRKPFDSLIASGRFGPDDVVADLADVVAGKKPGRTVRRRDHPLRMRGLGIARRRNWQLGLSPRPRPGAGYRDGIRREDLMAGCFMPWVVSLVGSSIGVAAEVWIDTRRSGMRLGGERMSIPLH